MRRKLCQEDPRVKAEVTRAEHLWEKKNRLLTIENKRERQKAITSYFPFSLSLYLLFLCAILMICFKQKQPFITDFNGVFAWNQPNPFSHLQKLTNFFSTKFNLIFKKVDNSWYIWAHLHMIYLFVFPFLFFFVWKNILRILKKKN